MGIAPKHEKRLREMMTREFDSVAKHSWEWVDRVSNSRVPYYSIDGNGRISIWVRNRKMNLMNGYGGKSTYDIYAKFLVTRKSYGWDFEFDHLSLTNMSNIGSKVNRPIITVFKDGERVW